MGGNWLVADGYSLFAICTTHNLKIAATEAVMLSFSERNWSKRAAKSAISYQPSAISHQELAMS
jgi:hypothetical protein